MYFFMIKSCKQADAPSDIKWLPSPIHNCYTKGDTAMLLVMTEMAGSLSLHRNKKAHIEPLYCGRLSPRVVVNQSGNNPTTKR